MIRQLRETYALQSVWPETKRFLCVFHFLQRNWTWFHDGMNKIYNYDRKALICQAKSLVFAEKLVCSVLERVIF